MATREQVPSCEANKTPREQADLSGALNKDRSTEQRKVTFAQRKPGKQRTELVSDLGEKGKSKKVSVKTTRPEATLGKSGKALLTTKRCYEEELKNRIEFRKQRDQLTRARVLL